MTFPGQLLWPRPSQGFCSDCIRCGALGKPNLGFGLNDATAEGNFVWASGDPVIYTNWDTDEPNDLYQNEDYVHIIGQPGKTNGRWNDMPDSGRPNWTLPYGVLEIPYSLPGDLNGDGFVGQADLGYVLDWWGQTVTPGFQADPTGDGFVGQFDLDYVLANWGEGTMPTAPVPEPTTLVLLALGGLALIRGRRAS